MVIITGIEVKLARVYYGCQMFTLIRHFSLQPANRFDMGRVDRIDVFAIFSKMVVCGNISTVSYVRGNISTFYKNKLIFGPRSYALPVLSFAAFFNPNPTVFPPIIDCGPWMFA